MSDNLKSYMKVGGLALACAGFAAYFLLNKKNSTQKVQNQLNREQVIKILKEFDKQFYGVLQNLAVYAMQINQQTQGKLAFEEIKEYLLQDPSIQEQISKIEEQIYQKFQITEETFKSALETQFSSDSEIQSYQKKLESDLNAACKGQPPSHDTKIPSFLTFQKVLQIFTEIMLQSTLHIFDAVASARESGYSENPLQSPEIQQALNPVVLEKKKEEILLKHGLDGSEDSASKVFTCAMQTYMKSSKDFNEIFKIIETHHQKVMVGIFKGQAQEREKVEQGYQGLVEFELQKLEMDKIIKEELEQQEEIEKQFKESVLNIEQQIISQKKEEILVDCHNSESFLESVQHQPEQKIQQEVQEQDQILKSEVREDVEEQDQILKSEMQEVYQENQEKIKNNEEKNEMVESQFEKLESTKVELLQSQEEQN